MGILSLHPFAEVVGGFSNNVPQEFGELLWGFTPRPSRGIAPAPILRMWVANSANNVPPKQKHPDIKGKKNSKSPTDKHTFISSKFMY